MTERTDWMNLPPVDPAERPEFPEGWRPSQTFLKIHDRCDRAAMLYQRFRAGAGGHELNRGAILHDVVADLTRLCIQQGEPRLQDPNIAKLALTDYMRAHPEMQVAAVERDALRWMVTNWALGEYFEPDRVLGVEATFAVEIGGFTIVGRIDRFDDLGGGVLEVIDYKTSPSMPSSEEFERQTFREDGSPRWAGNFQTMLYALATAFGTFDGFPIGDGYDRFKLSLRFPRYLRPDGLGERSCYVTRDQLLDFREDVELQLERLRTTNMAEGRWQPTPGNHCAECPAPTACPLPRILREESQLADAETVADLERIGTSWDFMSKGAAKLKRRIKARAEQLGDPEHPDYDPEALDLGNGDIGVRIGKEVALLFLPTDREQIVDTSDLVAAVEARAEYGTKFELADHVRRVQGTEFAKRKVPPA